MRGAHFCFTRTTKSQHYALNRHPESIPPAAIRMKTKSSARCRTCLNMLCSGRSFLSALIFCGKALFQHSHRCNPITVPRRKTSQSPQNCCCPPLLLTRTFHGTAGKSSCDLCAERSQIHALRHTMLYTVLLKIEICLQPAAHDPQHADSVRHFRSSDF